MFKRASASRRVLVVRPMSDLRGVRNHRAVARSPIRTTAAKCGYTARETAIIAAIRIVPGTFQLPGRCWSLTMASRNDNTKPGTNATKK